MLGEVFQNLLQVTTAYFFCLLGVGSANFGEGINPDAFHLMECWVVSAVDGVFAVNVSNAQERVVAWLAHQRDLVHRCVRTETCFKVGVVSV